MSIHRDEPPRNPPPNMWLQAHAFAQKMITRLEKEEGGIGHAVACGTLMVGVSLMKATGGSRELVLDYVAAIYDRARFRLLS